MSKNLPPLRVSGILKPLNVSSPSSSASFKSGSSKPLSFDKEKEKELEEDKKETVSQNQIQESDFGMIFPSAVVQVSPCIPFSKSIFCGTKDGRLSLLHGGGPSAPPTFVSSKSTGAFSSSLFCFAPNVEWVLVGAENSYSLLVFSLDPKIFFSKENNSAFEMTPTISLEMPEGKPPRFVGCSSLETGLLCVATEGSQLIVYETKKFKNPREWKMMNKIKLRSAIQALAVSPSGLVAFALEHNCCIGVWNPDFHDLSACWFHNAITRSLLFSPDSKILISGDQAFGHYIPHANLNFWNLDDIRFKKQEALDLLVWKPSLTKEVKAHAKTITCLKFDPFKPYLLLSSSTDKVVKIWNFKAKPGNRFVSSYPGHLLGDLTKRSSFSSSPSLRSLKFDFPIETEDEVVTSCETLFSDYYMSSRANFLRFWKPT